MNGSAITPKGILALVIVYLVWGTTLGAIRIGVETMPWVLLPCLRFTLAGLLLLAFCLLRGERLPGWREMRIHAVIGALLFFASNSLAAWTVQHISTGLGGLLVATTPFWMVGLSSRIPPREKVTREALLGIGIGFTGMIILLLPQLSHFANVSPLFWASIVISVATTFMWSLGSIFARKHRDASASLLMGLGLQNLAAGLLLVPFCFLTIPNWQSIHPSIASWTALAYLVLMGTIAATSCYLYTLKTLPITMSSTFAYVTPVITVLFGWLFLKEQVTLPTIIGSLIILAGVVVVSQARQPASKPVRVAESEFLSQSDLEKAGVS